MARSFLGGEFAGGESAWWRGNWIPLQEGTFIAFCHLPFPSHIFKYKIRNF